MDPAKHNVQICGSNVEIEYHGKHRAVNIEITPVHLSGSFNKSRPTFPHNRTHLEKRKIQYKFEIKTDVFHLFFRFSFSSKLLNCGLEFTPSSFRVSTR